jgi:hypothetical protein
MASSSSADPAGIAYISSEVSMETYMTLAELPWLNDEGLEGIISTTANFDSEFSDSTYHHSRICRCGSPSAGSSRDLSVHPTSPSPPEENRAKRVKMTSSNNGDNVKIITSKRVRGRLSELPTMPLDILYEVRDISLAHEIS